MLIAIDFANCDGHGMCALVAPEVFRIDDDGNTQFVSRPPESQRPDVREATQSCPVRAITFTEDRG